MQAISMYLKIVLPCYFVTLLNTPRRNAPKGLECGA